LESLTGGTTIEGKPFDPDKRDVRCAATGSGLRKKGERDRKQDGKKVRRKEGQGNFLFWVSINE